MNEKHHFLPLYFVEISKGILNDKLMADSLYINPAYIYDNSINNQLSYLLSRTTKGHLFKQYVEDTLEWAKMLLRNEVYLL